MLEGSLDDFTLPEILRLLAVTTKSGTLQLRGDGSSDTAASRQGRIVLGQGRVCAAASSGDRLPLGRRLLGAGTVTAEQLRHAVESTRETGAEVRDVALAEALVDTGVLDQDTATRLLHEQVQDAVFDLMGWTTGRFRFAGGSVSPSGALGSGLAIDDLLAECEARVDEWRGVRERIPSPQARVSMMPYAAEQAAAGSAAELTVSAQTWRLLSLIDGRRTVGELVDLLGQGEFRTGRALLRLVDAGLVEIGDSHAAEPSSLDQLLTDHAQLRELEAELPPPPGGWDIPDEPAEPARPAAGAGGGEQAAQPAPVVHLDDRPAPPEPAGDAGDDTAGESVAEPAASADDEGRRTHRRAQRAGTRLSTDPSIDPALVERLIDGVREL